MESVIDEGLNEAVSDEISNKEKENEKSKVKIRSYVDVVVQKVNMFDKNLLEIPTELDSNGNEIVVFDEVMIAEGKLSKGANSLQAEADLQSNPDKNGPSPLQESSSSSDNKGDFVPLLPAMLAGAAMESSPTILEAAKTLSKVASQGVSKVKSTDKGKRYMRRARSVAKNINTGLDAEKEINTGREEINIGIKSYKLEPKRMVEEEALSEQQEKRKAQVQFEAQYYTEEDWDAIRANRYCESKKGNTLSEERAKAKRNKPRPSSQLRIYMSKLSDESKTVKLSQLKKLSFEEIKEEFDKCSAIGEKVVEVKEEEPVKRTGKRKKQKARKGISVDKRYIMRIHRQDKEETLEAMNPTSLATKSNIVLWLKTLQEEDLIELSRTMFDPPLNEDDIWSLPLQHKMINWRCLNYFGKHQNQGLEYENCKKMQKNVLKHQFEKFSTASNESLDKAYDSLSPLMESNCSNHEKICQTLMGVILMNLSQTSGLEDEMERDGYVTIRVKCVHSEDRKEHDFKEYRPDTGRNQGRRSYGDNGRSNAPTNESSSQALVAMLTVRVRKFIQRTGRNMDFKEKQHVSLDKLKIKCYNCHRKGHFARECRSGRNQGRRSYGGYDWSNDFEVEPVNYALMAISSLSSSCSSDSESQEPKLENVVNTGQREGKPVWDNTKRVNHQNFSKYPHLSKTFVPSGVLTRTGFVSTTRLSISTAMLVCTTRPSISTAMHVCIARPVYATRPIYLRMDNIRPRGSCSPIKRSYYTKPAFRPKDLKQDVKTFRVKNMTSAGKRALVNTSKGKLDTDLKKSIWIWRPKGNYLDHVSKDSGSFILKKLEYGNPEILLQDHVVVDSGFFSHMTGNKAYLSDYEDFNGGFVAFGSDPKGGKITGKGKIKTANLDFDDVYFVDELKFNLFSVSQMCDKKNSVLFTESECLILSPSFKLLDESQVVLRAPRKDDVYSLDLKNIVPSGGITCLYANATADESKLWHRRLGHVNFKNINKLVKGHLVRGLPSKVFVNDHTCVACKKGKQHKASCKAKLERIIRKPLELLHMDLFGPVSVESINKKRYCLVVTDDFSRFSWVFFLATKDETSEILCKFIIGLENQLNHNVKIIRCDNGTEFKNYAMNEFYAKKGIKREFSVARTLQQNGVAERKNKTLIEAARTMLADSLLPIPFWAEAVNTACYVLNRVLVTKPQNKTPYELLIGKSPSISFMRPFGCPLTILNTLDSLGKFDGKSDEGYLLGYSTTSKAFRVYNKRTKRVEENLHINFLEDQPNVAGTGPNWMFDLDFLTNSMNYIPVSVENQVNVDVGIQDSYVAGSSGKDKGPTQEYILLPLQPHRTRIPVKDVVQDAQEKPSKNASPDKDIQDSEDVIDKEGQHQMPEDEQVLQDELEMMVTQELVAKVMDDISRQAFEEEKRRIASQKKTAQATSANVGESSFVYLGGKIPIDASTLPNANLHIDPNILDLEDASDTLPNDGIFNGAYDDDEDVGVVADFNNMDNTIAVSPIPTLRIHKDHPKGQILGDPTLAV
ncbi:putative ribonuclease H-like domain-containing protein [Tanacetum coccineum]|uniref:Ribonuclease H-like domain-containing protein n=1 Tax=Tanacetum coccineum TaxID=301880 RepID=A0ABQ5A6G1_9ASTR